MSGNLEEAGSSEGTGGQSYSCRFTDFHSNLTTGLRNLFLERDASTGSTDVTLVAEGRFIQAHKWLLAMCSPYFKNLFKVSGAYKNANTVVMVDKEVQFADLERLVHFVYHGEVAVRTDVELRKLLKAAELLGIRGLQGHNFTLTAEGGEGRLSRTVPPPPQQRPTASSASFVGVVGDRIVRVNLPRAPSSSAAYFRHGTSSSSAFNSRTAASTGTAYKDSSGSASTTQLPETSRSAASSTASKFGTPASSTASKFGTPASSTASKFGTPASSTASKFGTPASSTASKFGTPASSTTSKFGTPASSTASQFGTPASSIVTTIIVSPPASSRGTQQPPGSGPYHLTSGFKRARVNEQLGNRTEISVNIPSGNITKNTNTGSGNTKQNEEPEVFAGSSSGTGRSSVGTVRGTEQVKVENAEIVRKKCFFIESSSDEEEKSDQESSDGGKTGLNKTFEGRPKTTAAVNAGPSSSLGTTGGKPKGRGRPAKAQVPMSKRIPSWFTSSELEQLAALDEFMKTNKCPTCLRRFVSRRPEHYCRHISTHFEPNLPCPLCTDFFANFDQLRRHVKGQHKVK